MSLMAGFDFVQKFSNASLLKLLKSNLKIQGVGVNPPFEITVPISASSVTSSGHVIVNDLQLDLNADDTITLTLLFSNSSIIAESPIPLTMSALDGSFTIKAPIQLAKSSTPNQKVLAVDLGTALTVGQFLAEQINQIQNNKHSKLFLKGLPSLTTLLLLYLQVCVYHAT